MAILAGRSPIHLVVAVAFVVLAGMAAIDAFNAVAQRVSPDLVSSLSGGRNPNVLGRQADIALTKPGRRQVQQAALLARKAVVEQPLNRHALRTLGFAEEASGNDKSALSLIELSERTSRRNIGAHLWFIERAVRDNDIPKILKHYDLALKTSTSARELLLGRLVGGLSDPTIRKNLAPYVSAGPQWLPMFLSRAGADRKNGRDLALLIQEAGGLPQGDVYRLFETAILGILMDADHFGEAKRFYLLWDDAETRLLSSPELSAEAASERHGPFGWQLTGEGTYGASFGTADSGEGVSMDIFAQPAQPGTVASKPLFLAPGQYVLTLNYGEVASSAGATLRWRLNCVGGKRAELGGAFPIARERSASARLVIPPGCNTQRLMIDVRGGTGSEDLFVRIDAMELTRL